MNDPIWNDVKSEDFQLKYIQHEIPAIAAVAREWIELYDLKVTEKSLKDSLEEIKITESYNDFLPGELYLMIQALKEENRMMKVMMTTKIKQDLAKELESLRLFIEAYTMTVLEREFRQIDSRLMNEMYLTPRNIRMEEFKKHYPSSPPESKFYSNSKAQAPKFEYPEFTEHELKYNRTVEEVVKHPVIRKAMEVGVKIEFPPFDPQFQIVRMTNLSTCTTKLFEKANNFVDFNELLDGEFNFPFDVLCQQADEIITKLVALESGDGLTILKTFQ